MAFRRIALSLLVVMVVAVACAGSDGGGSSGITLDDPVAVPDEPDRSSGTPEHGTPAQAAVIKNAGIEMAVEQDDLTSSAQRAVDLVSSARIGGFLDRLFLDRDDGLGTASLTLKVPSLNFEKAVSELGRIGDVRRQELHGDNRSAQFTRARQLFALAQKRVAGLIRLLDQTEDPAERFELRQELAAARANLETRRNDASFIEAKTTYSFLEIYMFAEPPPPPPEKPVLDRSLDTAKNITLAIVSGIVLAAGVVVPIGILLALIYVITAQIKKRLRGYSSIPS